MRTRTALDYLSAFGHITRLGAVLLMVVCGVAAAAQPGAWAPSRVRFHGSGVYESNSGRFYLIEFDRDINTTSHDPSYSVAPVLTTVTNGSPSYQDISTSAGLDDLTRGYDILAYHYSGYGPSSVSTNSIAVRFKVTVLDPIGLGDPRKATIRIASGVPEGSVTASGVGVGLGVAYSIASNSGGAGAAITSSGGVSAFDDDGNRRYADLFQEVHLDSMEGSPYFHFVFTLSATATTTMGTSSYASATSKMHFDIIEVIDAELP